MVEMLRNWKIWKNMLKISYAFQKNFFVGVYQQVVELDKALATFNSFSKRCVSPGWQAHSLELEKIYSGVSVVDLVELVREGSR